MVSGLHQSGRIPACRFADPKLGGRDQLQHILLGDSPVAGPQSAGPGVLARQNLDQAEVDLPCFAEVNGDQRSSRDAVEQLADLPEGRLGKEAELVAVAGADRDPNGRPGSAQRSALRSATSS
jgi:hypothetical protein